MNHCNKVGNFKKGLHSPFRQKGWSSSFCKLGSKCSTEGPAKLFHIKSSFVDTPVLLLVELLMQFWPLALTSGSHDLFFNV